MARGKAAADRLLFVVFLAVAAGLAGPALAQEDQTVQALGLAPVAREDVAGARKDAVLDAKRNAVDQVGSSVVAQTVVENFALVKDRIVSRAEGYIRRYDVLEEGRFGPDYRVKIEARVGGKAVMDDAVLLYREMGKPRLMVVIPEVRGAEVIPTSQAEAAVSEFMLAKGFTLVDAAIARENIRKDELRKIAEGDAAAAAKAGLRAGAEVVLTGSAALGDAESVRGVLWGSKATVSLKAVRTGNAELYAVASQSQAGADATPEAARRKALDEASRAAARDLFWKVVRRWNEEATAGTGVEVLVTGVAFPQVAGVRKALEGIPGVSDLSQRGFDAPTATFSLTFQGDAMRLAERVDAASNTTLRFEVTSVSPGKLNLKVK